MQRLILVMYIHASTSALAPQALRRYTGDEKQKLDSVTNYFSLRLTII